MAVAPRQATGLTGFHAGVAAEDCVARDYENRGLRIVERRWRGEGGEIDLIAREGDTFVFVEVKKSRSFDAAAARLGPRQVARLFAAAEEYCAALATGSLTDMRFDVALVDARGAVRVIENAFA